MKKITFLSLLSCLFLVTSLFAQTTYYVKLGGNNIGGLSVENAFTTVNNAVQAASDGDTINIVGPINQTGQAAVGKSISFVGQSDATITGASVRMYVVNAANKTISFTGITFQDANSSNPGAVITITQNSDLTLTNCILKNNVSADKGGAILASGTGILTITNSLFDGNSANKGGAIAITSDGRQLIITGSTFVNNSVSNNGGALYLGGANANSSITSTTIFNNTVNFTGLNQSTGGGIRIEGVRPFTISNSLIYGNFVSYGNETAFSDIGGPTTVEMTLNHSITKKIEPALDDTAGDVFSTSKVNADLTSSNLTFNPTTGNVEYDSVSSSEDSPIDFGSDGNDAGSWNSGLALSLDKQDVLAANVLVFHNKSSNSIEISHTISTPLTVEVFSILGTKLLDLKNVTQRQSIQANSLATGIYILKGKSNGKSFSKKFIIN